MALGFGGLRQALLLGLGGLCEALLFGFRRALGLFTLADFGKAAFLAGASLGSALFFLFAAALGCGFGDALFFGLGGLCEAQPLGFRRALGFFTLADFGEAALLAGASLGGALFFLFAPALGCGFGDALLLRLGRTLGLLFLPNLGKAAFLAGAGFRRSPLLIRAKRNNPAFFLFPEAQGSEFGDAPGFLALAQFGQALFLGGARFSLPPFFLGSLGCDLALLFLPAILGITLDLPQAFRFSLCGTRGQLPLDGAQFVGGPGLPIELLALKPGFIGLLPGDRRLAPTLEPPVLQRRVRG